LPSLLTDTLEATAIFPFTARSPRELTFKKGDRLRLYTQVSADWWKGSVGGGSLGLLPDKYIAVSQPVTPEIERSPQGSRPLFIQLPSEAGFLGKREETRTGTGPTGTEAQGPAQGEESQPPPDPEPRPSSPTPTSGKEPEAEEVSPIHPTPT
jgi:hypothetical protein